VPSNFPRHAARRVARTAVPQAQLRPRAAELPAPRRAPLGAAWDARAMGETVEREFMGKGRSRIWTYLILMVVLVAIIILINVVWKNPTAASEGFHTFLGLPSWALATVMFGLGAVVFWLGLKVETDWPEAIGAFLIAAATAWFELILGWSRFELGLIVVPYVIPVAIFALLLMIGMKKSV
jgi:hypothetical protein